MFDSVYIFAKGLASMDSGHSIKPTNLSCDMEEAWNDGLSLYNYIDAVRKLFFQNVILIQTKFPSPPTNFPRFFFCLLHAETN